jgi:hypothetical protein
MISRFLSWRTFQGHWGQTLKNVAMVAYVLLLIEPGHSKLACVYIHGRTFSLKYWISAWLNDKKIQDTTRCLWHLVFLVMRPQVSTWSMDHFIVELPWNFASSFEWFSLKFYLFIYLLKLRGRHGRLPARPIIAVHIKYYKYVLQKLTVGAIEIWSLLF